jgi:2-dehydropantoate 2-reductase
MSGGMPANSSRHRMLVVGAGVNGSVCAAGLYRAGIDTAVLARGRRYEELRSEGIVIEDPFSHRRSVTGVPVIGSLDPADCYDFVLVVVRKNQVVDLLPVLAENRSANIVFMGNNLLGPGEFINILGRDRVLMGAVFAAGKRDGSLIRALAFKSLAAPFGEVDGTISPRLRQLVGILRQAGFQAIHPYRRFPGDPCGRSGPHRQARPQAWLRYVCPGAIRRRPEAFCRRQT